MNKVGWFLTGIYVMGLILDIMLSYYDLGTINQRVTIYIFSIMAIGFNIIFLRDKKNERKNTSS